MKNMIIDHRMKSDDRRSWNTVAKYPFMDSKGDMVFEDRRVFSERRGCELEEIFVDDINITEMRQSSLH